MMMFDLPILGFFWAAAWFIAKALIVTAITTGLSMLLAKRAKGPKPAGVNEFNYPTAMEGRPLMVVWGKRRVLSCNAITPPFHYRARKSGSTKRAGVYYYYIGLHIQVCHALDGVAQIWMGGKCLWPTFDDPSVEAADATATAAIMAHNAFGGPNREGGFKGTISIQYGAPAQARNAYLTAQLGTGPAYRGMVGLIWERPYIGTTPYIKPMSVLAKRTDIFCDHTEMWYVAKANVGDDHCNPIHVIYEMLTSTIVGCGKSTSLIGASFEDAADTCYDEGYGVDIVWDSAPDDIQEMIDKLCEVIDGRLYQDLSTGKFEIALARADYDEGTLDTYDESYFWVEQYECPSPAKTPSKTIVKFHDRLSTKTRPAYDDDIALMEVQGSSPVVQEFDYSGFVTDEELALKIAAREQNQASAMPKYLTLQCDRRMADLHKGSVIKISYPALNIASMIVRVLEPEYGSLKDGGVRLHVMEDVFGQVHTTYGVAPLAVDAEGDTDPIAEITTYGNTTTGTITWDSGQVDWNGQTYAITGDATGTTDQYIWFDPAVSTTELQHGAAAPSSSTAVLLYENVAGVVTASHDITTETEVETVVEQSVEINSHYRLRETADERLYLEQLDDDTSDWTTRAKFGEAET